MNGKSKLTQQEQTEALQHQATQPQTAREFANAEELLRFDSSQNPVPGKVAERVQQSVEREQIKPPRPWWKRLLGK